MEKDGGMYEFSAVLTPEQHQFLLEHAIRDLVTRGLMPFNATPPQNGEVEGYATLPDDSQSH